MGYREDYDKGVWMMRKVVVEEKEMFEGGKVSEGMVRIEGDYVGGMVRGKERKWVELGGKVNNIEIEGIWLMEEVWLKGLNEGIGLKECMGMEEKVMNVRVRCVGGDWIYGNNGKRKLCRKYGIWRWFVGKGRGGKDEGLRKVVRREV